MIACTKRGTEPQSGRRSASTRFASIDAASSPIGFGSASSGWTTIWCSPVRAAKTWRQLAAVFGEQEARALFGLTNVLVMFGGSKDGAFNQEISDLVGQTRVSRTTWQTGAMAGRTFSGEDIAIIRPEEIRRLHERGP
jgi:hypothetical protein